MKSKPNGIVTADAIKEEVLATAKEERIPTSSNVISIFRKKSTARLSDDQVNALFHIVFHKYQKRTGARVAKYGPDGNN
jgi:hypothetical protein